MPSLSPFAPRSTKDFDRIFRVIWLRWTFTVISLTRVALQSVCFGRPVTTRLNTSRSRDVRELKRSRSSATTLASCRRALSRSIPELYRVEQRLLMQWFGQEFNGPDFIARTDMECRRDR